MAVEVSTSGTTGEGRRATSLNYNSAYTVLFRFYLPSALSYDFMWGIGGTTGYNGGNNLGNFKDCIQTNGAGTAIKLVASGSETITGFSPGAGWHSIAVVRSSATAIKLRYNGSNSSTITNDVSAREAVAAEFIGRDDNAGNSARVGFKWTNYKSWSKALSDAEIDAEMLTTSFVVTDSKYSGSPMDDESTLANNATADGSGTSWTFAAGLSAGTNDPSVTYGSPAHALVQSGAIGLTGTVAVLGDITAQGQFWRVPTNAAGGASAHVIIYSGSSPTYSILAQGVATSSGGFFRIPATTGTAGDKAFAFVHNYGDDTATTSIFGGPAIATRYTGA